MGPAPIRSKEEWYLVTVGGGDFARLAGWLPDVSIGKKTYRRDWGAARCRMGSMIFYGYCDENIDLFWNMIRYFFWEPGVMPEQCAEQGGHATEEGGVVDVESAPRFARVCGHLPSFPRHCRLSRHSRRRTAHGHRLRLSTGAFPAVAAHTAVISAAGTLLLPALFPVSP